MEKWNSEVKSGVGVITINDLRGKELSGDKLDDQEKQALQNYDQFRIKYLNSSPSETIFSERYLEMQTKAKMAPYTDFLSAPYNGLWLSE